MRVSNEAVIKQKSGRTTCASESQKGASHGTGGQLRDANEAEDETLSRQLCQSALSARKCAPLVHIYFYITCVYSIMRMM